MITLPANLRDYEVESKVFYVRRNSMNKLGKKMVICWVMLGLMVGLAVNVQADPTAKVQFRVNETSGTSDNATEPWYSVPGGPAQMSNGSPIANTGSLGGTAYLRTYQSVGPHVTISNTSLPPTNPNGVIDFNYTPNGYYQGLYMDSNSGASLTAIDGPNITVAAWVNITATTNLGILASKGGYGHDGWALGTGTWWDETANNRIRFEGNGVWYKSTAGIPLGQWTHVAVTNDGTDVKIYINGNLDSTHGTAPLNPAASDPLVVGAYHNGNYGIGNTLIGEINIYDSALSQSDVQTLLVPEPISLFLLGMGGLLFCRKK
jgi:hypothetical protein